MWIITEFQILHNKWVSSHFRLAFQILQIFWWLRWRWIWVSIVVSSAVRFTVAEKLEFCFHCICWQAFGSQNRARTWDPSAVCVHHTVKFPGGKVLPSVSAVEGSVTSLWLTASSLVWRWRPLSFDASYRYIHIMVWCVYITIQTYSFNSQQTH